jgi:hypothetical protein
MASKKNTDMGYKILMYSKISMWDIFHECVGSSVNLDDLDKTKTHTYVRQHPEIHCYIQKANYEMLTQTSHKLPVSFEHIDEVIKNGKKYTFKICDLNQLLKYYNITYDKSYTYEYAKEAIEKNTMKLLIRHHHKQSKILNKLGIDINHINIDYKQLIKKG